MLRSHKWEGYSQGERTVTIENIKSAIQVNDGCIMNFNIFSDLAITLSIEIPSNRLKSLLESLSKILTVSVKTPIEESISAKEQMVSFNVSFSAGTGNMRNEIPDVPG